MLAEFAYTIRKNSANINRKRPKFGEIVCYAKKTCFVFIFCILIDNSSEPRNAGIFFFVICRLTQDKNRT